MIDINEALAELKTKNYKAIQIETAEKWAARSMASYQYCLEKEGLDKLAAWTVGTEYGAEAIEHAAMVEGEDWVSKIRQAIEPYEQKAYQYMIGGSK